MKSQTTQTLFICTISVILIFALLIEPAHSEQSKSSKEQLQAAFKKLDSNGDRKLSAAEIPEKFRSRAMERFDVDQDGELNTQEARQLVVSMEKMKAKKSSPQTTKKSSDAPVISDKVKVVKDIEYAKGASYEPDRGKLDLYLPKGSENTPVLFFIHGGGLKSGDKSKLTAAGNRFALHGFAVVTSNYRLYPDVIYPSHIRDVAKAFRWVYDNIESYGGDPNRIFVTGGSAGGQLTALLVLNERFLAEQKLSCSNIKGAIPISGLVDVDTAAEARQKAMWGEDPNIVKDGSAITHISKDAPPMLILVAENEKETRIEQNKKMFEAFKSAGHKNVSFTALSDRTHNSIRPNMANEGDQALMLMLEFMKRHGAGNIPFEERD